MTSKRALPETLSRTALFRDQPKPVLAAISESMWHASFAPGQMIFARGDPGDALYLMTQGRVRISILAQDGRELSFTHAVPNDIFGEIAVLDGSPRSANATALTDVHVFILSRIEFNTLVDRHASFARSVIRFLCTRLREISDHLEDIALLPLEARLARFFLNRVTVLQGGAANPAGPVRVSLGMSQSELALLLGASRPKVNAALMTLAQSGAITRDGEAFACHARVLADLAQRDDQSG